MEKSLIRQLLGGLLLSIAMYGVFGIKVTAAEAELEIILSIGKSGSVLLSGVYVIWDYPTVDIEHGCRGIFLW